MARQVLFRGYDIIGNKWVYGDLTHNQKVTRTGLEPRIMVAGYEVDPESVGECTGLHDKHRNAIYEHDLLRQQWGDVSFVEEVVWRQESAGFLLDGGDGTYSPIVPSEGIIVGNIFEKQWK